MVPFVCNLVHPSDVVQQKLEKKKKTQESIKLREKRLGGPAGNSKPTLSPWRRVIFFFLLKTLKKQHKESKGGRYEKNRLSGAAPAGS